MTGAAPLLVRIPPPLWALLFIGIALGADAALGWPPAPHGRQPEIGAALVALASALTVWARVLFAREGTQILPASPANRVLVTRGPFAASRNPMYLGILGVILGVAVWTGATGLYGALAATFAVIRFGAIPFEEAKMERQFGDDYRAYKVRVRRWI